ncbi:glycosyltransferase family 4 protein, partial [Candidatus Bathyarchaeota archaeon]|nr:glycosyltransferase family 4 protein [Candidatus Bathyarchaeota archaeon]
IFNFHRRPILAKMAKWILSSFDVIITLAKKSRDELTAIGLSGGKMKLCTHWVDLNEFRPLNRNKCKENLGLNRKFVILFVGRFIAKKGIDVLLDVASEVNPEVVFAFIGDGPLSAKIRERARDQQNIIFVGKVPKEDLVRYYNAADSLIIPSQYEELFGRVVIEALACGTPVIASNKGTLPEIVDPSVGIVVDPSREDIVKVVNFLYENPEQLARMRSNCRHYASANFSEKNAEDIASAYKID